MRWRAARCALRAARCGLGLVEFGVEGLWVGLGIGVEGLGPRLWGGRLELAL